MGLFGKENHAQQKEAMHSADSVLYTSKACKATINPASGAHAFFVLDSR